VQPTKASGAAQELAAKAPGAAKAKDAAADTSKEAPVTAKAPAQPTKASGAAQELAKAGSTAQAKDAAADTAKKTPAASGAAKELAKTGGAAKASDSSGKAAADAPVTFQSFYNSHATGRGIAMWSNALDAYQRHLGGMAGKSLKLAEIGVQSGGSIEMWEKVLGSQCKVYGIDPDPDTKAFKDKQASIMIADNADPNVFPGFFSDVTKGPVDVLVDQAGFQPELMFSNLQATFDNVAPGGMLAMENLHGDRFLSSFWQPAAQHLGDMEADVFSVHVYPYMFIAQRSGGKHRPVLNFAGSSEVVTNMDDLMLALWAHPEGHVILRNTGYDSFLSSDNLNKFFTAFSALHEANWNQQPENCVQDKTNPKCTVDVQLGSLQSEITGFHVYPKRLVVEVAPILLPRLQSVRMGTKWISR